MRFEKVGPGEWHGVSDPTPPQKPWYSDAMEEAHRRTLTESGTGHAAPPTESEIRADQLRRLREQQAKYGQKPLATDEAMERIAKSRVLVGGPSHKKAVEYFLKRASSGDLKGTPAQKKSDDVLRSVVERGTGTEEANNYVASLIDKSDTPLLAKGGKGRSRKRKPSSRSRKTKRHRTKRHRTKRRKT